MNASDISQRPNPTRLSADNDSRPRTTIREMRRSLSYEDSNSPPRRHPDASLMRTPALTGGLVASAIHSAGMMRP